MAKNPRRHQQDANHPARITEETLAHQATESLDGRRQHTSVERTTRIELHASSGPLPHPDLLRQYEEVLPGAAREIFDSFREQALHRQGLEQMVIAGDNRRANWGVWLAYSLAIIFLVAGATLVATGHSVEGMAIATLDLTSLAGLFIYATRSRRAEREAKDKQVPVKRRDSD